MTVKKKKRKTRNNGSNSLNQAGSRTRNEKDKGWDVHVDDRGERREGRGMEVGDISSASAGDADDTPEKRTHGQNWAQPNSTNQQSSRKRHHLDPTAKQQLQQQQLSAQGSSLRFLYARSNLGSVESQRTRHDLVAWRCHTLASRCRPAVERSVPAKPPPCMQSYLSRVHSGN